MAACLWSGLLAVVFLAPLSARALTVRIDFAGTITGVFDDGISDGSVVSGGSFSGSALLDLDAIPNDTSLNQARYIFATPPFAYSATFGAYEVVAGPLDPLDPLSPDAFQVAILDGTQQSEDLVDVFATATILTGGIPQNLSNANFRFSLRGASTVLSSTALNDVPWDLAAWGEATFEFGMEDSELGFFSVDGTLDSMTMTLPEPRGLALLGLSLLALAGWRRSRSPVRG